MTNFISELAVVHEDASLGNDVYIGPFCVVDRDASIGCGTRLESHVSIRGRVSIGRYNTIHPFVVIGGEPQDKTYAGTATQVVIGDHNVIRESVTINRGSEKESGVTSIGSHCFVMACSHVAHDCRIGDHVIVANGTLLGGHVHVHDYATLSGAVAVHHFTTIGRYSFVSGVSRVLQDVPPYLLVEGIPTRPRCANTVGLKRHEFPSDVIDAITAAHRLLYRTQVGLDQARQILRKDQRLLPQVTELLSFIQNQQEGRHGRAREIRRAA